MIQAERRKLYERYCRMSEAVEELDAELCRGVDSDGWFACDICGDIQCESEAGYMGEDAEEACAKCRVGVDELPILRL